MSISIMLAFSAGVALADCEDVPALVSQGEQALLDGRIEETDLLSSTVQGSLSCGAFLEPEVIGRFWLVEGVRALHLGEQQRAELNIAAAQRTAPSLDPAPHGDAVVALWEAVGREPMSTGTVMVHPETEGLAARLNGEPSDFPATTVEGLHLVQVGAPTGEALFGSVFYLPPADTFFVLTGLEQPLVAEAPAATEPAATEPAATEPAAAPATAQAEGTTPAAPLSAGPTTGKSASSRPPLVAIGGATAAMAIGSAFLARTQRGAMSDATDMDSLDSAFRTQKAWAFTSYGLMGVTATAFTLHFTW